MSILPSGGSVEPVPLVKMATYISGLDEVLDGGLPMGCVIAITGGPGTGKTLLALQFLANRAVRHGEAAIVILFEESPGRVRQNLASLTWGVASIWATHVTLIDGRPPSTISVSGDFDLDGLLAIVDKLCEQTGARTVVLDGLDALIANLPGDQRERQELARIARWNADRGLTCIITVKGGLTAPAAHYEAEFIHYITDCFIELDAKLYGQALTRTLRVVKYRGSGFASNAYPAVLSARGFDIMATEVPRHGYATSLERLSTGIESLDEILGGGLRRGTSTLISGAPGTAKTTLCGHIAAAACARGEKVLFISFDQGDAQIVTDLASVGTDLQQCIDAGLLVIQSLRSGARSPEEHLSALRRSVAESRPDMLLIDPVSSLSHSDYPFSDRVVETLVEDARQRSITFVFSSLTGGLVGEQEISISNISTVADTWLHFSYNIVAGERNRALSIVKSRGTAHSNQLHELVLSSEGFRLLAPYAAEGAVLMGTARVEKEAAEHKLRHAAESASKQRVLELRRRFMRLESELSVAQHELGWTRSEMERAEAEAQASEMSSLRATADRIASRSRPVTLGGSVP